MYQALYRTERPEDFSRVLGQEHIVRILKNQIRNGTTSHAYLFCGTRGTGKTTVARILAKAVNCTGEGEKPCCECPNCRAIRDGNFMDMIEIDAASNNGVDNVRELRESVNYPPSQGKKKVYIIDEVHMLSNAAFNALLKTLEEPPESVMFILATTDPQRLPATVLSRCLRLDFRRIPAAALAERMREICGSRGVEVTNEALQILAAASDGSVRDGLSILDRCLAGSEKTLDGPAVIEYLGTAPTGFFIELTDRISSGDIAGALTLLDRVLREGKDVKQILGDWLAHYRSLLIAKYVSEPGEMLAVSAEKAAALAEQSRRLSLKEINNAIVTVAKVLNDARYSTQPRVLMELAIVTLAGGSAGGQTAPAAPAAKPQARQNAPAGELLRHTATVQEKMAAPAGELLRHTATVQEKTPAPAVKPQADAPEAPAAKPQTGPDTPAAPEPEMKVSDPPEAIWERIWDYIPESGSINMLKGSANLTYIDEKIMEIQVDGEMMYRIAERSQKTLSDAAKEVVGGNPKVILRKAPQGGNAQMSFMDVTSEAPAYDGPKAGPVGGTEDRPKEGPEDVEAIARALEEKLHIKPTIEK